MTYDTSTLTRVKNIWRRTFSLSWPVATDNTLRTVMRTTDIIVTGFFSPAAIAALGLADLYGRIPLAIGQGFGSGAIALSSQDTGRDAVENRNETITQALLFGALLGIPFIVFGLVFGTFAIELLGATHDVALLGGQYLAIIFASAPARHVGYIGARCLQGTGDTRTPMKINMSANFLNIIVTVPLGLGLWWFPSLGIVGVGLGTALGNVLAATLFIVAIRRKSDIGFTRPADTTIARQLVVVSTPKMMERVAKTAAQFPFNSILLLISVEANAAWQIGRRLYQQLSAPLLRAYNVAASVIIGQTLGERDFNTIHFDGAALAGLGIVTVFPLSVVMIFSADRLVWIFTDDPLTASYAIRFTQAYGVAATFSALFRIFGGALQGGGETRKPFAAETTGVFLFLVGGSYLFAIHLDYGIVGTYLAIVGYFLWRFLLVTVWFTRSNWIRRAEQMMDSRQEIETPE